MESKLEVLSNIAQALEKTRAALDDGIDEPGEQDPALRNRFAGPPANPSAKAKAELGEAFDSPAEAFGKMSQYLTGVPGGTPVF